MSTPPPSAEEPADISSVPSDTQTSALQTTFRVFAARLDPATREALRVTMGLRTPADLDAPRPQDELAAALRPLR